MNLLLGKVESRLVVCPARIHDHAVQATRLLEDLLDGGIDGGLLGDVGADGLDAAGVLGGGGGKLLTRLSVVDRVDDFGVVVEAGLCDAEADAAVGSGDCEWLSVLRYRGVSVDIIFLGKRAEGRKFDVLAMTLPVRPT